MTVELQTELLEERIKKWRQFIVTLAANLASCYVGICLSWSSPSTVKLNQPDTPLTQPLTTNELGWITSLTSLGAVFGSFIVYILIDKIGRKWSLLCSSITFTLSIILLIIFQKLWAIYLARFLQGLTIGIVMTTQPIYNAEIATDDLRGALGSMMPYFMMIGGAFIQIIGPKVNYEIIQWICLPFCIIFPPIFIFMPDTPHFYIAKGYKEKAKKSLMFLRGQSLSGVQNEYEKIEITIQEKLTNHSKTPLIYDLFKDKINLKALGIALGLVLSQQCSGIIIFQYNIEAVFSATQTIDTFVFFIYLTLVQLIAASMTVLLIDKFGRKIILLLSGTIMCLSLIGIGLFFHFQKFHMAKNVWWLPILCILLLHAMFNLGYGPVVWVIVGEIFSIRFKSIASAIVVSTCWITSFIVSKAYPTMEEKFGLDIVCWVYAIFTGLSVIFISFYVFETKGMSLQNIQKKLSSNIL